MWDDVIIGSGERGISTHNVSEIKGNHSISANKNSYWISNVYLGLGMTIFRDTD